MHLFETTAILSDSLTAYHNPLQIVFVLKEDNGGKLDSHRWFFNALAAQVRPTYTFLVDVGTKPDPTAVWKLYGAAFLFPVRVGKSRTVGTRRWSRMSGLAGAVGR